MSSTYIKTKWLTYYQKRVNNDGLLLVIKYYMDKSYA